MLATVYGDICYSWYKGQYRCANNGKHELSLLKINSSYISSLTNRIALCSRSPNEEPVTHDQLT